MADNEDNYCNCCGQPSLTDPCSKECFEQWQMSESILMDTLLKNRKEQEKSNG
jgi:hypothetical protein